MSNDNEESRNARSAGEPEIAEKQPRGTSMMSDASNTESVEGRLQSTEVRQPSEGVDGPARTPPPPPPPPPSRGRSIFWTTIDKIKGAFTDSNFNDSNPFYMTVEPSQIVTFRIPNIPFEHHNAPVLARIVLSNPTKIRQAFKVKCTSNEMFRVSPPLGFCEPGQSTTIKMSFTSTTAAIPSSGRHFFSIYHVSCADKRKSAREVWSSGCKPDGARRLRVYFELLHQS